MVTPDEQFLTEPEPGDDLPSRISKLWWVWLVVAGSAALAWFAFAARPMAESIFHEIAFAAFALIGLYYGIRRVRNPKSGLVTPGSAV